ncbi:MAG: glutamine-hydrolyzing carbamoyl-phosphate synthase small subunit [Pseudomonadota bacterium]|nr:glutamine-hydrolyzing carbamoyl-phosphate synthase small subunit [Pseudomonadota bacterium]
MVSGICGSGFFGRCLVEYAILALEDGSLFHGVSIGASGASVGEVVFNTALTGYQEILSDPSYAEQIVTLTYPHIGNVGVTEEDQESAGSVVKGLVIKSLPPIYSNWRSQTSLSDYLKSKNIVGIAEIDTRRLTRLLREKGSLAGCIYTLDHKPEAADNDAALEKAKAFPGLKGMDLAKVVSSKSAYKWTEGTWKLNPEAAPSETATRAKKKVVAYDFGVKTNILRLLVEHGCDVEVVPAQTPAEEVLAKNPDGVFLSNGPGDPEPCDYAINAIKVFLDKNIPIFGICLGHQLLSLASGAKTMKMAHGHHGANHPVQDLETGKVLITSQNHGFCVDEESLPEYLEVTHRSLFDQTIQGIRHKEKPAFGFQGHPEASPGPLDLIYLFETFYQLMDKK